jgi:hypothetical protein
MLGIPLVEMPVDFAFTVFDPCSQAHIYTLAASVAASQ